MSIKEVERVKGSINAAEACRNGIHILFQAGIIDAIRALGRPLRRKNGADQVQMAAEAAWSSGWNDCLDTLLYFEEQYLGSESVDTPKVKMDFGSLEAAVASGDLTEEEADAIRSGKPITYDPKQFSSNIKLPTRS